MKQAFVTCFDVPCGALFVEPSRWPETNLQSRCATSTSHLPTSLSFISQPPQNSRSVCAQSATHQNTHLKADLSSVVISNP